MNAITIENIVAFDMDKFDKILGAKNTYEVAQMARVAYGYVKMWRDYHRRENIDVSSCPDYETMVNKIAQKRLKELEQNERFIKNKCYGHMRMNKTQLRALLRLYNRHNPEMTFLQLRRKAFYCYDDYFGINLAGMFIGIEKDGYTHT